MMRLPLTIAVSLLPLAALWIRVTACAETVPKSPQQVVEAYAKIGDEGKLLTAEGWNQAQVFFVRSSRPSQDVFVVIDHPPKLVWIKGNKAEVDQEDSHVGKLDSALRLIPPPKTNYLKSAVAFYLVLTDKHWESGEDGKVRQLTHAPEWKIENPQVRWASVEAAIRYTRETSAKTKDPVIRENALQTIAILKHYLPKTKASGK